MDVSSEGQVRSDNLTGCKQPPLPPKLNFLGGKTVFHSIFYSRDGDAGKESEGSMIQNKGSWLESNQGHSVIRYVPTKSDLLFNLSVNRS